jgi:hypothetical protein
VAYNKEEIVKKALSAIEDEECVTIEEVLLFLPISTSTFYAWELEKSEDLKAAINAMKVKLKKKMRRNWRNSDNATLQIAEFKLISTDDERDKLNTSKVQQDTNHTFNQLPKVTFEVINGSPEQSNEIIPG